jgi:DNA invertase Pin-like site-specific DNA recombinase
MTEQETAAAYIRVSTQQQKDDDSHVRQRERMSDWADDQDVSIEFFEDIAISGQSDERDSYDELMDDFAEYDYIVVRELSRFGRDPVSVLHDVEEIAETDGVEFVSVTEPMLDTTSAHGKLMVRLIASINGFHADLRREQAQRMVERRKEKGLPVGRPTKLNDEQMEEAIEWRRKGLSYGAIATLIEDTHGVEISESTIYRYCQDHDVKRGGADD